MPGVAEFLLQLILDNFWFLYSLFMNFVLVGVLLLIYMRMGPLVTDNIKVALGFFRKPALIARFTNAQITSLRIREYAPVMKLDEKDPGSELIHLNREDSYRVASEIPEKKQGLLSRIFKGKQPVSMTQRLNEIYTDDFIPVEITKKATSYTWGLPLFVVVEGVSSTINPMMRFTQAEQVRAASIAVEQAFLANKLLAIDDVQKKIATKDDVRNWSLLTLGVVGVGLILAIMMIMGIQQSISTFIEFINTQWTTIGPVVEQIIKNTPRIVQGEAPA